MSTESLTTPDPDLSNNVVPLRRGTEGDVTPADATPGTDVDRAPEVLVGEIVEDAPEETTAMVAVDQPTADTSTWVDRMRGTDRQPIIPGYLRTMEQAKDTAKWVVRHYAHTAGFHAVRSPIYAAKLAARSPRGALLLLASTGRWVSDAEGRPVRRQMANQGAADMYLKLAQQRDARVRARTILLLIGSTVGVVLLFALPMVSPSWVLWTCGLIAAALLGRLGTPADKPVAGRAVLGAQVAKLTSDTVVKALSVLSISGINSALAKNPNAIGFTAPITRDGPGWRAEVDLPAGVTAAEVTEKRVKLASGLGRPLGCVWPEGKPEVHPGRLVLWVGDQDMGKARQPAWSLRKGTAIDLFAPQPFGTDQRGKWVELVLMFVSGIIGAVPRMGKTFTLRELLLIAAMDPRAELHPFDLKGTGDLSPLAPVAHRYRAGDDPADIEYAVQDLRELREEMRRRTKVIRELPKDLCPESKVTTELANNKSLALHPIVVGVDECQVWFEHAEYGKEIEEIVTDLVKRGPATGIVMLLATQRPDSKSIPTQISDNAILRFCLKVAGQVPNDMVLGTSSYQNGVRATTFAFSDKGIGILKGVGDEPLTVKGVYIDAPDAEKIVGRARALRTAAGRLTGYAAGVDVEVDQEETNTLLEDVATAIGGADKAWSESIVDRLAELRPATYGAWGELPTGSAKATTLAGALKPYGITTKQVWGTDPTTGKGANRMGVARDWITDALTERDGKPARR
ncbi:cell division protein FtsK [Umezawaea sp. NPDC059074]|uniref:cell division protein FtsK n=1 Tax=Umezawaea sp. NPDC059074 TaxID=3346716 RepID=UPI00368CD127